MSIMKNEKGTLTALQFHDAILENFGINLGFNHTKNQINDFRLSSNLVIQYCQFTGTCDLIAIRNSCLVITWSNVESFDLFLKSVKHFIP